MNRGFDGALVSIHDVTPAVLDDVDGIIDRVRRAGLGPPSLLVVPGLDWDSASIASLRRYAASGHALAGHGWRHRAERIRGIRHRLHSLLLSRDVAEHLALDADGIARLIRRCRRWFDANGLPAPALYVPPAWALGAIPRARLAGLGFRYYETLGGIFDSERGCFRRLPLLGYEADTRWRRICLGLANGINERLVRRAGAVRVAIHPADFRLGLADALEERLRKAAQAPSRRPAIADSAVLIRAAVAQPRRLAAEDPIHEHGIGDRKRHDDGDADEHEAQ